MGAIYDENGKQTLINGNPAHTVIYAKDTNGNPIALKGNADGSISIQFVNATVSMPIDKQAIYRTQAFITTTPLGAGASYTSASFDGIQYRRLTGKVYADQAGTLNLQHSDDGTNWDTLTSINVPANTPTKFDELIYARYVRVNYVNGSTAQTIFRLSGYLSAE